MNRRRFFWGLAGIGGALAGIGAMVTPHALEGAVERRILSEFNFLKLEPEGVRRFASEYSNRLKPAKKRALEFYCLAGLSPRHSRKIHRMMNDFLLSTDFFLNNMDESRTIRYVALNDPQARPCNNPFNNLSYPSDPS
jgi:hypothetical protein